MAGHFIIAIIICQFNKHADCPVQFWCPIKLRAVGATFESIDGDDGQFGFKLPARPIKTDYSNCSRASRVSHLQFKLDEPKTMKSGRLAGLRIIAGATVDQFVIIITPALSPFV